MNHLIRRVVQTGCAVAIGAAMLLTGAAAAQAKPIKIRFSHVVAENTPKGKAAAMFARLANERLKGRVEVQVFPNSQLYTDKKVLDALVTGGVEMAAPSTSKFTSWVPELQLFDLPFLFKNSKVLYATMDGPVGKKMFRLLNRKGMLGLAMWDNGYKQLGNNVREIRKPADAAGLKYRIMSSKVLEAQFNAMGGSPLVMPFSEVYSALEQGVIDGQENTWSNMYSKKFHEVQKYITETNHGYLGYLVVTNDKFWHYLPPDVRNELNAILREVTAWIRKNALAINLENKRKIIAAGTTKVTELNEAELALWRQALRPVHDQFRDVIGGDLIDAVYKLNEKY